MIRGHRLTENVENIVFAVKYYTAKQIERYHTMKGLINIFAAVLLACMAHTGMASDYAHYYQNLPVELAKVTPPSFPERTVSVTAYGAVGDGLTLCTEAFRKAIDAVASEGGGHVTVPQGVWLTGPVELKSNVDLHVEKNAIICFSPDKQLYEDTANPKASRVLPCITAVRCTNIAITGEGIIDGNGAQWRPVKRSKVSDVEWRAFKDMGGVERQNGSLWYPWDMKAGYANVGETPEKQEKRRNDLFRIYHCENVMLRGVTFQNAPKFHVHPFNSRNIIIDGVTVRCPWNAQNGDAIDISDCHRVLIVNSTVDAGDDGLCMKSGERKEGTAVNGCEDILIENNTVFHAHGGFVIGSEDICGMRRIVVRNCRFSGTDTGLRFKSAVGRGGRTENIFISGIVMNDIVHDAIIFECNYANRPAGSKDGDEAVVTTLEKVPEFADIHISDVTCRGTKNAITASGISGMRCVHGITVDNSTFIYRQKGDNIDAATAELKLTNVRMVKEQAVD